MGASSDLASPFNQDKKQKKYDWVRERGGSLAMTFYLSILTVILIKLKCDFIPLKRDQAITILSVW